jgi:predicted Fe-Mo cluster-binding NifX family protein
MKVCFPVQQNEGVESAVYGHFGSAPFFVVVDTETKDLEVITNRDRDHAHGACNPLKALDDRKIDAVIVGGIGAGALSRLNQSGIKVCRAGSKTIQENIARFAAGDLPEFSITGSCGGHGHGGTCAHERLTTKKENF